eukprot:366341-Chlamydomonas_euryale.AAC.28
MSSLGSPVPRYGSCAARALLAVLRGCPRLSSLRLQLGPVCDNPRFAGQSVTDLGADPGGGGGGGAVEGAGDGGAEDDDADPMRLSDELGLGCVAFGCAWLSVFVLADGCVFLAFRFPFCPRERVRGFRLCVFQFCHRGRQRGRQGPRSVLSSRTATRAPGAQKRPHQKLGSMLHT